VNRKGATEYLVKWKDNDGQSTWETMEALQNVSEMVAEFERKSKEQMGEESSKVITKNSNSGPKASSVILSELPI
jgi:Chromo (CHRromatin Organisation MOdifier) domain